MMCPYNRKKQTNVIQWVQEYNDDGQAESLTQISTDTFDMLECPRDGCAAWYHGRCHYAAVSLENE